MHTPPKTPELNATAVGGDEIGLPEEIELKQTNTPTPQSPNPSLGSNITGMVGTSDQFSSISTADSLDDDDNFADALALMKIEGTGIIGKIEKIPLPIKLLQLSILAIIGMLVLSIIVIILQGQALEYDQGIDSIFSVKNRIYEYVESVYNERTNTVLFLATRNSKYNSTIEPLRNAADAALKELTTNPTYSRNERAKQAVKGIKDTVALLVKNRKTCDALRVDHILSSKDFDVVQDLDETVKTLLHFISDASNALTDDIKSKKLFTLETITKLRASIEHMRIDMIILIAMSQYHKNSMETLELAVEMNTVYDITDHLLFQTLDDTIYKDYLATVQNTKFRVDVETLYKNVTRELIAGRSMPNISLTEWTTKADAYIDALRNFELKWQGIYTAESKSHLASSIVYIILITVFILVTFCCICGNSLIMSKTITGPWQKMNYLLEQSISKFVPKDFLYLIHCHSVTDVKLGKAEVCDLTVLTIDFKHSIKQDDSKPGQTIKVLNQIFSFIGSIIRLHNGYIEKYNSTGCECVFTHPKKAVFAALDLEQSIATFNADKKHTHIQILSMVIGIHSDKKTIIGTIGETERMESAIVSQTSRLSHGIKNLAKKLKSKILISRDCLGHVKKSWSKVQYRYLGGHPIETENSTIVQRVYELFNDSDPRVKYCREFSKAVSVMEEGQPEDAIKVFKVISTNNPLDACASQLHFLCSVLIEERTSETKGVEIRDALLQPEFRQAFMKQLAQEYSQENLLLWEGIVEAIAIGDNQKQFEYAQKIFKEFLSVNAKYDILLSHSLLQKFRTATQDIKEWKTEILTATQKEAENLMIESFTRYKTSPVFKKFFSKQAAQNAAPNSNLVLM